MSSFFCFIHIEKAGGITLHNLLHRVFPYYISPSPEPKFGEFLLKEHFQKIRKKLPFKIQGIGGHKVGGFLNYESILEEEITYFTFMRDPITRYMSHLNWQKNVMGIDWTIEAFVEDEHFNNYQAYRIAGVRDYEAAAVEMKKIQFVGLLEQYHESLLMLAKVLNIPLEKMLHQKSNTKIYKEKFLFEEQPNHIKQKIIDNNAVDLKLYSEVKNTIFKEQIVRYGEDKLKQNVEIYRKVNKGFLFSKKLLIKRKLSNWYLKKIIQPSYL